MTSHSPAFRQGKIRLAELREVGEFSATLFTLENPSLSDAFLSCELTPGAGTFLANPESLWPCSQHTPSMEMVV